MNLFMFQVAAAATNQSCTECKAFVAEVKSLIGDKTYQVHNQMYILVPVHNQVYLLVSVHNHLYLLMSTSIYNWAYCYEFMPFS